MLLNWNVPPGRNGLVQQAEHRAIDVVLQRVIVELDAGVVGDRVAEVDLVTLR